MKVRNADTVYVQQQYRSPQPLLKKATFFDPLGEVIRRIRDLEKDEPARQQRIGTGKIDLRA